MEKIYFAAGCFWGTQRLFSVIQGVTHTECGYANGKKEVTAPTYPQVCSGDTDCREAVAVQYDPDQVSLPQLLKAFFHVVDPTVFNRQGNDIGTQYQTGIYYCDPASERLVKDYAAEEARKHRVFAVEIAPLEKFYPAEEYHQDYLIKNPQGYCHISPLEISTIDAWIRSGE